MEGCRVTEKEKNREVEKKEKYSTGRIFIVSGQFGKS